MEQNYIYGIFHSFRDNEYPSFSFPTMFHNASLCETSLRGGANRDLM